MDTTRLYTIQLSATELEEVWDRTVGQSTGDESDVTTTLFVKIDEAKLLKQKDAGVAIVLRATKEQLKELQQKLNDVFQMEA